MASRINIPESKLKECQQMLVDGADWPAVAKEAGCSIGGLRNNLLRHNMVIPKKRKFKEKLIEPARRSVRWDRDISNKYLRLPLIKRAA